MNAYVYPNYFGNIKAMSIASLAGTVVILTLSTFIVKLASKIGKKELSMIGCFISAASFILLYTQCMGMGRLDYRSYNRNFNVQYGNMGYDYRCN